MILHQTQFQQMKVSLLLDLEVCTCPNTRKHYPV